jgi:ATP synthase assembly factor FMC1, mitochondrial
MSSPSPARLRSLYRSLLRLLPPRGLSESAPLKQRLRSQLAASSTSEPAKPVDAQLAEADQFLAYLRAQRTYAALLERYNPGMNMTEEEHVRLTMRRVGMELPTEFSKGPRGRDDTGG